MRTNCVASSSTYTQVSFTTATPPVTCPGVYDVSTNGNRAGAALIPLNTDVEGTISPVNDVDFYSFTITTGGTITATLTTLPANYQLDLQNAGGTRIGRSRNGGTANETINLTVTAGTYYARVYPSGSANNATNCYTLKITTGTASFGGDEEIITDSKINIFPNPASSTLTVNIPQIKGNAVIMVFDLQGKLLLQQSSTQLRTVLKVKDLASGFYLVKVSNGGKESSFKILKQ